MNGIPCLPPALPIRLGRGAEPGLGENVLPGRAAQSQDCYPKNSELSLLEEPRQIGNLCRLLQPAAVQAPPKSTIA